MGWLSDFIDNPVGTLTNTAENLLSDPLGTVNRAIDTGTRGIGDTVEDAAPAIIAAAAIYFGIPPELVTATELGEAAAAGAITAADVAVATPYLEAGMVTGTALEAGAAGAGAAAGAAGGGVDYGLASTGGYGAGGIEGMGGGVNYSLGSSAGAGTAGLGGTSAMLGSATPASTSLMQQLSTLTGLSTSAIERLGGAAISSLASMYGAGKLGQASMDAANRLAASNQTATQLQSRMYEDQVARQQPFYQAGLNALPEYTKGVMPGGNLVRPFAESDFKTDPGYGFRMSEGMKGLERSAAARGGLLSGATLKGAQRFGQDIASNEYNNAYNRYVGNQATQRNALAGLTGFAPTAAQQIGAAGTNYATNVNNLATNTATNYANADLTSAAARQSAYMGAGGAFANALTPNPLNAYLNKQLGLG